MEDSSNTSFPQKEEICSTTMFQVLNEEDFNPILVFLYDLILLKQFLLADLASKWFGIRSGVSCIVEILIPGRMSSKINTYT